MGFTCRYLERKQNKTKHTKKQTPGEEIVFGLSVIAVYVRQLRCNWQTSDKRYVDNQKKNKMAPDMI